MKVRATNKYEVLQIVDGQLGFIPKEGYEFEVTEDRYKALAVNNTYNVAFVEKVEEPTKKEEPKEEVVEVAKKKATTRKAVKKTTKKAK